MSNLIPMTDHIKAMLDLANLRIVRFDGNWLRVTINESIPADQRPFMEVIFDDADIDVCRARVIEMRQYFDRMLSK